MSSGWARFDADPGADAEAAEMERLDADLELAETNAAGDAIAAARRRGVCCHQSAQGYSGGPRSAAQEGLKAGQVRCTDPGGCGAVFGSDEEWMAAMDEAVTGDG